jgi:hypothetical protein
VKGGELQNFVNADEYHWSVKLGFPDAGGRIQH